MKTTRPLPEEFTKKGFTYSKVWRENNLAIYAQTQNNLSKERGPVAYEVIVVKVAPETTIMGNPVPEREVYPSSDSWGARGWTCKSLSDAHAKVALIAKR